MTDVFLKKNRLICDPVGAIVVPQERSVDIDTILDFKLAEFIFEEMNK